MGIRPDGVHVFGVLHGADPRSGDPLMTPVEATGYSIALAPDGSGEILTLSGPDGEVVEQFQPEAWTNIIVQVPGVDDPDADQ
jgi:hypothetical protein